MINDQLLLSSLRTPLQDDAHLDSDVKGHRAKRQKLKHNAPILFVKIKTSRGKKGRDSKSCTVKVLVDTGASDSIMTRACAEKMKLRLKKSSHEYLTAGGLTDSSSRTEPLHFKLPELNSSRKITKSFQILKMATYRYDLIIGRDLMSEIGLDVLASNQTLTWNDAIIPWRNMDSKTTDNFSMMVNK